MIYIYTYGIGPKSRYCVYIHIPPKTVIYRWLQKEKNRSPEKKKTIQIQVSKQVSGLRTSSAWKIFPAELRWYFLQARWKSTWINRCGAHKLWGLKFVFLWIYPVYKYRHYIYTSMCFLTNYLYIWVVYILSTTRVTTPCKTQILACIRMLVWWIHMGGVLGFWHYKTLLKPDSKHFVMQMPKNHIAFRWFEKNKPEHHPCKPPTNHWLWSMQKTRNKKTPTLINNQPLIDPIKIFACRLLLL